MSQSTKEFFKSLNFDKGLETVTSILKHFPMQYATTLGLDGRPQIRPWEYKFEKDGVLYFDCADFYASYKEMQKYPYLQLCIGDQESMSYLRLGGKVNFTKDPEIVAECFRRSPVLCSQFGNRRQHIVGYYLTEAWAEFSSFDSDLPNRQYSLKNIYD